MTWGSSSLWRTFSPYDDRIVSLGLHRGIDLALGWRVIVDVWWEARAEGGSGREAAGPEVQQYGENLADLGQRCWTDVADRFLHALACDRSDALTWLPRAGSNPLVGSGVSGTSDSQPRRVW